VAVLLRHNSLDNGNPLAVTTINMPRQFVDEALVIAGFTVDVNGNESPDGDAPIREDWVFAQKDSRKLQASSSRCRARSAWNPMLRNHSI